MATEPGPSKWSDLFSNLREEVVVVGVDRAVLYVNQPVLERLGSSLDYVVGRPCHYVFEGDSRRCQSAEKDCPVQRVLETGQPASVVYRQRLSARQRYYLQVDASPLRDSEGTLTAVMCLPRDLGLPERYQRILNTMREGMAVVSRGGRIIEVNSALCQALGFSREELAARNVTDFVAPDLALAWRDSGKDVGTSLELELTRKDGSALTAEVAVSPLSPELEGLYLAFVRDVTVQKQKRESMEEQAEAVIKSAAEFKSIFEASNDALVVIEDDTTVAMVNRRFEEITSYRWHDVEGKMSFLPLVSEEDRDQALAVHHSRRERSQAAQPRHKMWMTAKDGRRWLAEVSGAMIPGTRRSLVALRDITEAHTLQQALERRNRDLEVLHTIAAVLSRSTDLTGMLNLVLDVVVEITGKSRGVIALIDEEQRMLLISAYKGHAASQLHLAEGLKLGEGLGGRVAKTGKPLFIRDIGQDSRLTRRAVLDDGLRALACVPLVSSGKVLGVMSIFTIEAREFSSEEQHLLISIGNEIGVAVERAQHLERARDRAREASNLMLVTQEMASSLELQTVLDRTLAVMCMQVWADQGRICLFDETREELVTKSLWGEEAVAPGTVWKLGQGVAGWVAMHHIALLCDDVATDPRADLSLAQSLGYHSIIAVPLMATDKLLGVVAVTSKRIGAFSESHLRLLSAYAAQASTALEKSLLHQRVKDVASSLTESMRKLAASEDRFRALIEHSSDSILVLNAGGEITYASPSTSRITGYASSELVGLRAFELIDPEDRDQATALFDEVKQKTGRVKETEIRARNKEGRRAWIELTATNLLDNPSVQGVVVNWRDISGRKRAERERERLIAILEATPDVVAICDLNGRLLYANTAGRRALRLAEGDDLSNRTITDLVQDETRNQITHEIIPSVIRDGRWTGEITSLGLDGQEISRLVVAQAHRAPDGGVQFLSAIARDITELTRVRNVLQAAAEEWRTTFDGITEGILLLDTERRVLRCNSAMQAFLGLPFQEILGRHCCDLVCGATDPEKDCTALRAMETKRKETAILQNANQWFAITVYPLEKHEHVLSGIVYIMSDITAQRKQQEALRQSENKVRKLAAASVRAQEEERQWVADEVHDRIAQTLVAVHQQLQALGAAIPDDLLTQRLVNRALELQQQAINETRNIMRDLYSPTLQQYGLVTVIQEELHQLSEDTGFQTGIDTDCPVRPPKHVEGVLYRIFHEALLNVRKHGAGAKMVAVSVKQENDEIIIVVRDDGPGFDVEAVRQSRLFGGLVSMRRRAEILGGTFEVTSGVGQGTRVRVSVPSQHGQTPEPDG